MFQPSQAKTAPHSTAFAQSPAVFARHLPGLAPPHVGTIPSPSELIPSTQSQTTTATPSVGNAPYQLRCPRTTPSMIREAHPRASTSFEIQQGYSSTPQTMANNPREVDNVATGRAPDKNREV